MGGKHRLRGERPRGGRLVCIYFGEPTGGEPSAIRECRECERQVMVATLMLPLVESGQLYPVCHQCNAGRTVTIHPVEEAEMARRGWLGAAWRRVAQFNETSMASPPDFIQIQQLLVERDHQG